MESGETWVHSFPLRFWKAELAENKWCEDSSSCMAVVLPLTSHVDWKAHGAWPAGKTSVEVAKQNDEGEG